MKRDLIFDFGMHDGGDSDFYLRKGFRVVAVEADPDLAAAGQLRFASAIAEGRMTVVNKAIAAAPGRVTLHRSNNRLWSTLDDARAEHVARKGSANTPVEVEATTSAAIIEEFGAPYYLKIDIEGMDTTALASLRDVAEKPCFVSMESERRDLPGVRGELALLTSLGYDRFQVVAQHRVKDQREPSPPREGSAAGPPLHETSGLFGEDLPGPWLTETEAVDAYRRPLINHYLTGSDPLFKNRWLRAGLKRLGFRAGWYDTHARLAGT